MESKFTVTAATTLQELFSFIVGKLSIQGKRSMTRIARVTSAICAYRGTYGSRCAAGWILPDEVYGVEMEGKGLRVIPWFRETLEPRQLNLLSELQQFHDDSGNWNPLGGFSLDGKVRLDRIARNRQIVMRTETVGPETVGPNITESAL
jgi:hypothetical protein